MKVLFLAYGPRSVGSSRLRAWNIADAWKDADCLDRLVDDLSYDAFVFQKQKPHVKFGSLVIWDLCDPVWWWIAEDEFRAAVKCCDAITVSSDGLADDLRSMEIYPIVIPDRLPPSSKQKIHSEVRIPKLVWFGYATNRLALNGVWLSLQRLVINGINFKFRIIDDMPDVLIPLCNQKLQDSLEYIRWNETTFEDDLLDCDIVLLPPYPDPWGAMKSQNKLATASWAGLPVVSGENYYELLELISDWKTRQRKGLAHRQMAEEFFDISQSVEEWKVLVSNLKQRKAA